MKNVYHVEEQLRKAFEDLGKEEVLGIDSDSNMFHRYDGRDKTRLNRVEKDYEGVALELLKHIEDIKAGLNTLTNIKYGDTKAFAVKRTREKFGLQAQPKTIWNK